MHNKIFGVAVALLTALLFTQCSKDRFLDEPGAVVPKTVDQDPSLPAIQVGDARLHAEAYGPADSALIVVLHGGPGSDYRALLNCADLADYGYRVVFYDQRGSGLSQRFPEDRYSLQLMLDDLSGVIAHYRTHPQQKVFLLGHSWGGMLATAYINANPAAIDGVVLAEPGGFRWDDVVEYVKRTRNVSFTRELANDLQYADQFITGRENRHEILDYKYGLQVAADGAPDNPTGNEDHVPFWRFGAVINLALFELGNEVKPDWTTNLHQFDTPVLFLYSENNSAYGADHARYVSSAYPDVELVEIFDAGHDMFCFPTGWNQAAPKILQYFNNRK